MKGKNIASLERVLELLFGGPAGGGLRGSGGGGGRAPSGNDPRLHKRLLGLHNVSRLVQEGPVELSDFLVGCIHFWLECQVTPWSLGGVSP